MLTQSNRVLPRDITLLPVWDRFEQSSLGDQILDQLQIAAVVLDAAGTVLFCSTRARRIAECSGAIIVDAWQRLHFADPAAEQEFRFAMRRCANKKSHSAGMSITILAGHSCAGDQSLIGTLHPLSENASGILMTLANGDVRSRTSLDGFTQAFGLTPAEQRLARHLAAGGCLRDAAKSFGLSQHTVRNQLRSIFEKVGVRRQVDLTRLMCTASPKEEIDLA